MGVAAAAERWKHAAALTQEEQEALVHGYTDVVDLLLSAPPQPIRSEA